MSADIRATGNQAPPLVDHNTVTSDRVLAEAVSRHASAAVLESLVELGHVAGSAEAREHAMLANRNVPELYSYDRYGNRVDEVRFHPSWHWLMQRGVGFGLQSAPWASQAPHPHVRRAAGFFAWSQTEPGHGCPISMTYAAVPALRADDAIAEEWTPRLASTSYDFGLRPAADKAGALAGMGMTEKQGGSDVRANVTTATPTSVDGEYLLDGHKWFTSAPMNDVFLVLRVGGGDGAGHQAGCGGRPGVGRTRRRSTGSRCRWRSTGSASAHRHWSPRPSSAWAATGSSRTPGCRCCSGSRR
jgi:putative acyl-CoA dehydrogenase